MAIAEMNDTSPFRKLSSFLLSLAKETGREKKLLSLKLTDNNFSMYNGDKLFINAHPAGLAIQHGGQIPVLI
jgi:hypothetical protein